MYEMLGVSCLYLARAGAFDSDGAGNDLNKWRQHGLSGARNNRCLLLLFGELTRLQF